jgi:hypothetical protein
MLCRNASGEVWSDDPVAAAPYCPTGGGTCVVDRKLDIGVRVRAGPGLDVNSTGTVFEAASDMVVYDQEGLWREMSSNQTSNGHYDHIIQLSIVVKYT